MEELAAWVEHATASLYSERSLTARILLMGAYRQ
jgi:hypothetical protein